MKIKSIIDSIKESVVTGSSSDVRISDNSFLVNLFRMENPASKGEPERKLVDWNREIFRLRADDPYPVCCWLARVTKEVLFSFVWLFYAFFSCIVFLFTHKWQPLYTSPRFNFVTALSSIIATVAILVSILTFYVNDVLLFSNSTTINRCGALATHQACGEEHYMYLFNTAKHWSDTGIEILAGDRVRISGSGAYYSIINDMRSKAEKNDTLRFHLTNVAYPLISCSKHGEFDRLSESERARYCMYSEGDAVYGSLLYQIVGENEIPAVSNTSATPGKVCQVQITDNGSLEIEPFVAETSGVLHVAVNDIYLDSRTVNRILEEKEGQAKGHYDELRTKKTQDEISCFTDEELRSSVPDLMGEDAWFRDNCGDVLLNVSIERQVKHLTQASWLDKLYTGSYLVLSRGHAKYYLLFTLAGLAIFVALFRVFDRRVIRAWLNKQR